MKRLNILWIGLISVLMTACYDDYEKDYDKSSVYFASQKPLRTLVADTDMSIKVGVAIGGKERCIPMIGLHSRSIRLYWMVRA